MGKYLRISGLVVGLLGALTCRQSMYGRAWGKKYQEAMTGLLANGKGSMYRICDKTGDAIMKFTSVDFTSKAATDVKNYFYSIQNPKEYLNGDEDAVTVEKGPYVYRMHTVNHDISFETSDLTEHSEPKETGKILYKVADAYVVLDKDTALTSGMQRSVDDLTLSWTGEKTTLTHEKAMADHLSMSDELTNLSPEYLSVLGTFNDEVSLVLSMSCTEEQVENVMLAGPSNEGLAQCTDEEMNDYVATGCACCMLDDDYVALTVKNTGSTPPFKNCNEFLKDNNAVMSTLSLHAAYDSGVAVKDAGEKMYDGSGSGFVSTKFGQTSFYSAAVQTHSVNEVMFGYPSAFVGKVVPAALLSTAQKVHDATSDVTHTKAEVATLMLTGQMDDKLPFKLGNVAEYTKKVGAVCSTTCEAVGTSDPLRNSPLGWMCSGNAPAREDTSVLEEIVLGGIDCKPYSSTFATKMQCDAITVELTADPNSAGYEACMCADGSNDWSDGSGCCLAAGMHDGMDLTGSGCLFSVPGEVGPNYLGKDVDASNSLDVGKAIEAFATKEDTKQNGLFMCPGTGSDLPEHDKFNRFELYEGSESYTTYYDTGRPRIQQNDKMLHELDANASVPQVVSVSDGSEGLYFAPRALREFPGELSLQNGRGIKGKDYPLYFGKHKMPLNFRDYPNFDANNRAKVCGSEPPCLLTARMKTLDDNFVLDDTPGSGMPFDGLKPIGHADGPSHNGRPAYIHQALYLNGDTELLSQQNNSHVEADADGNGIKLYRPTEADSDPGAFSETSEKYELVSTSTWSDDADDLRAYFDLETASGLVVRSRIRLGKSYALWECDPLTNDKCDVGRKKQGERSCYADTGAELYDGMEANKKAEMTAAGETSFSYPCSASNLITPDVIGGKVIPSHWSEEYTTYHTNAQIDKLAGYAVGYYTDSQLYFFFFILGKGMALIGTLMFLQVFMFDNTMNTVGVSDEKKSPVDSSSAASTAVSNVSAASTAGD